MIKYQIENLDNLDNPIGQWAAGVIREQQAKIERLSASTPINIVFDGPPGPEAGRFVEVETDDGESINIGTWIERPDGLWALRIVCRAVAAAERGEG